MAALTAASLAAIALTASAAAHPRATSAVPTWRGSVDFAASAQHPADPEYRFDGPDSFTYSAHATFKGRRSTKTEGRGWRGTLTWTFNGVMNAGTRDECNWSGSGSYPVDILISRTGGDGDPIRLGVTFYAMPGVGVAQAAMGALQPGNLPRRPCDAAATRLRQSYGVARGPEPAPEDEVVFAGDPPAGALGCHDLELMAEGTGRMSFSLR